MLLVDEIDFDEETGVSVSKYTVPEDAIFVQGHFPGNPIVPGVVLCEIMAQGGNLVGRPYTEGMLTLYAGINSAKFKGVVRPGDTVVTTARLANVHLPLIVVTAEGRVNGKLCCKGEFSFILTDKPTE